MSSTRAGWIGMLAISLPSLAAAEPLVGPYVSLGAGVNLQQNEIVTPASSLGFDQTVAYTFHPGVAAQASLGYGIGYGLRAELEGDFVDNVVRGAQGLTTDGLNLPRRAGGVERKYGGFVNILYDFDFGLPITPYLGFGAGGQAIEHTHFNQSIEGVAVVTPLVPLPAGSPALGFHDQTVGGFAYQGIAGASFALPWVPGLAVTAEYRFMGLLDPLPAFQLNQRQERLVLAVERNGYLHNELARYVPYVVTGNRHFTNDYNHEFLLGIRYALFQPRPPTPAPLLPPLPEAPPQTATRTYLVFFDWDRADLSSRARQIVATAADASRHGTTRLEVDGYTDLSGTQAYNQKLSVRRAATVQAELVRDGVPPTEIAIAGHGEANPMIPTAPGVREPQNRRVEIVLR